MIDLSGRYIIPYQEVETFGYTSSIPECPAVSRSGDDLKATDSCASPKEIICQKRLGKWPRGWEYFGGGADLSVGEEGLWRRGGLWGEEGLCGSRICGLWSVKSC